MSRITKFPLERYKPIIKSLIENLDDTMNNMDKVLLEIVKINERLDSYETKSVAKPKAKKSTPKRSPNKGRARQGVYNKGRKKAS